MNYSKWAYRLSRYSDIIGAFSLEFILYYLEGIALFQVGISIFEEVEICLAVFDQQFTNQFKGWRLIARFYNNK